MPSEQDIIIWQLSPVDRSFVVQDFFALELELDWSVIELLQNES